MKSSEQINELASALAMAQSEIQDADFDKVNPHLRNKYASVSSVLKSIRPVFARYGLSIMQTPFTTSEGHFLTTMILHKSGQYISSSMEMVLQKNDMQGLGSAMTYARRYMAQAFAGISGEEDDDGEGAGKDDGKPKAKVTNPLKIAKEEIEEAEGNPAKYIVKIGTKHKGKTLEELGPSQVYQFKNWLQDSAAQKNEPLKGTAAEFVEMAERYLTKVDAEVEAGLQ